MQPHNPHEIPEASSGPDGKPVAEADSLRVLTDLEGRPPHTNGPAEQSNLGSKLTIFAVLLAVALAVGFLIVQHRRAVATEELNAQTASAANAALSVDVVSVKYAPPTQSVAYPGDTRGWYESTIYARVNGYVGQWYADIGDHVKKGQVLATIDTPDLDAQYQAACHQLAVSQSQVNVVEANAAFAKSTYDRWRDSPKGVVSDQEREEKKAEFSGSVAQLRAAQAKVSADQADVDRLQAWESYKQVTAPFEGVVTQRRIDIGDLVTAGSTENTTSLYSIAQINEIRIFVDVPQRASAGMEVGVPAVAVADEFPDRKFEGTIARTSHAIDPVTRTLRVEVDVENPDGILMPGMYMEVNFKMAHKGLLEVPASALLFRSSGPQVAVVAEDGRVHFRDVSIAIDNGDTVELQSGVLPDDKVALNLNSQIAEGDAVTAVDFDSGATITQAPGGAAAADPAPIANANVQH